MNNIANNIYDNTAELGLVTSKISLIFGTVVSIILLILGFFLIFKKNNNIKINATVESQVSCSIMPKQPTQCNLIVSYNVNNTSYRNQVTLDGTYNAGDTVQIQYDKTDPNNISKVQSSTVFIGIFLVVFAVLLFAGLYINYYFTSKSKVFAASEGVNDIARLFNKF